MINYSRQSINSKEIKAVTNVLKSNYLTQGPLVQKFEKRIKNYCKSKYAVAVNSATSGLHITNIISDIRRIYQADM